MTKEQIDFLVALQNEMNTQDTNCQADPRFWVVAQYEWQTTMAGCEEETHYYDSNSAYTYKSFEALIEGIIEEYSTHFEDEDGESVSYTEIKEYYDLPDEIKDNITEIPVAKVHVIKENTFFLTQRECKEHITRNKHHYNDSVHTYAMTAWRSPQVEKLYKILQEVDFSKLALSNKYEELRSDVKKYSKKSIEYIEKGIVKIVVDKDKLVQYGIDEKEVDEIVELENKFSRLGEE
ncbi:MAG: hypothetical protein RBQ91_02270 [Acholeplasma sp.]|nr:hypothetical protein [Acholeplasma sp.]